MRRKDIPKAIPKVTTKVEDESLKNDPKLNAMSDYKKRNEAAQKAEIEEAQEKQTRSLGRPLQRNNAGTIGQFKPKEKKPESSDSMHSFTPKKK